MTAVSAKVYRGRKDGKVVEGNEIFAAGDEELLLKVSPKIRLSRITTRSRIPVYAELTCITLNMGKSLDMKEWEW